MKVSGIEILRLGEGGADGRRDKAWIKTLLDVLRTKDRDEPRVKKETPECALIASGSLCFLANFGSWELFSS